MLFKLNLNWCWFTISLINYLKFCFSISRQIPRQIWWVFINYGNLCFYCANFLNYLDCLLLEDVPHWFFWNCSINVNNLLSLSAVLCCYLFSEYLFKWGDGDWWIRIRNLTGCLWDYLKCFNICELWRFSITNDFPNHSVRSRGKLFKHYTVKSFYGISMDLVFEWKDSKILFL